jgi:hypothetical protein
MRTRRNHHAEFSEYVFIDSVRFQVIGARLGHFAIGVLKQPFPWRKVTGESPAPAIAGFSKSTGLAEA